jgi:hypothetical protein
MLWMVIATGVPFVKEGPTGVGQGRSLAPRESKSPQHAYLRLFFPLASYVPYRLKLCICLSFAKAMKSPAITLRTRTVTTTTVPR